MNGEQLKNLKLTDFRNEVKENPYKVQKTKSANDNENYNDGFVMEDMNIVQQDQPYQRQTFLGQMQREPPAQDPRKRLFHQTNVQLTREIVIKQGRLRGLVRSMHPQTGLKSVRQYLGIPYAAAPLGNARFMPPGLFPIF